VDIGQQNYKANEALQAGDFKGAQDILNGLIDNEAASGGLHYNLGIAYYRDGQLGKAIYHFRKSKIELPRNADVAFNLNYARKETKDKIENTENIVLQKLNNNYPLNLKESSYFLVSTIIITTIVSVILLYKSSAELLVWLRRGCVTLLLLAAVGTGYRYLQADAFGVIKTEKANVYSGRNTNSVLLFTIHEGTEFSVEEDKDDWTRIALADGKKGWIRSQQIIY